MAAHREWSDDTGTLRRFGLALARDDQFIVDDVTAARLVDKLIRQSFVSAAEPGATGRLRIFARFIGLYRRHVRRLALEENEAAWAETQRHGGVAARVRALPLELREALLLVVLAEFSHVDAAAALDIPLACLLERLERARERLCETLDDAADETRRGAPHLRVIK